MTTEYKSLQLKAAGEGKFSGYASRYGELDSYNEVTVPGSFDQTVKEHGGEIVILSDHDPNRSIGLATMSLRPAGLFVEAKLSLDLNDGRDAYIRLRDGLKSGLSIGYLTQKDRYRKDGVRE